MNIVLLWTIVQISVDPLEFLDLCMWVWFNEFLSGSSKMKIMTIFRHFEVFGAFRAVILFFHHCAFLKFRTCNH